MRAGDGGRVESGAEKLGCWEAERLAMCPADLAGVAREDAAAITAAAATEREVKRRVAEITRSRGCTDGRRGLRPDPRSREGERETRRGPGRLAAGSEG